MSGEQVGPLDLDKEFTAAGMKSLDKPPVPIEKMGRDHWSTLAFLETQVQEGKNKNGVEICRRRMRTDQHRHHWLVAPYAPDMPLSPTRLKGTETLPNHDDWDCLEDFEALGLVEIRGSGLMPVHRLTDKGLKIALQLREFKANGGSFDDFAPSEI